MHTLHDTGPVASVAWADAAGRPADPIALATGANVYVYNLSGATDALQVCCGLYRSAGPVLSFDAFWICATNSSIVSERRV